MVVGDVIAGIRLVLEVLCPPGPVVVPLPCYPPFRDVVAIAGRELVPVTVDPDAEDAALDLAAVEDAFRAGARTLLLCNPHNPLGRVAAREELEALAALARGYDARVVADEIHGPLTLPGATFTPYLSVDDRGILVTSPSKTFNTAGLHTAQVVALDPAEQARLRGVPLPQNHAYSPLGMIAAVAAWTDCDDWHAALVDRLDAQRRLLGELLATHLPRARTRPLRGDVPPLGRPARLRPRRPRRGRARARRARGRGAELPARADRARAPQHRDRRAPAAADRRAAGRGPGRVSVLAERVRLGGDEVGVPVEGPLRRALLGLVVDVDQAEALGVALGPLEVVHQRPRVVAADVDAAAGSPSATAPQVGVEVVDAGLVVDDAVLVRAHAVGAARTR